VILRLVMALGAVGVVMGSVGCQRPTYREQGGTLTVYGVYANGVLASLTPPETRVPAVMAAAEETLRRRGYTITRRDITEDLGVLRAEPPHAVVRSPVTVRDPVTVRAVLERDGTMVTVRVGRLGNEAASRAILDEMLRRVGL